eukprot:6212777-Pleurochrysis_carterae.AAC.3
MPRVGGADLNGTASDETTDLGIDRPYRASPTGLLLTSSCPERNSLAACLNTPVISIEQRLVEVSSGNARREADFNSLLTSNYWLHWQSKYEVNFAASRCQVGAV